jgi:hypothetical protein
VHEFEPHCEYHEWIQKGIVKMVPTITSQDLYLWMEEFTPWVEDPQIQRDLKQALQQISAVWKFRNVLYQHSAIANQWHQFKKTKLLALAHDWLDSLGL